jgi:hypothetical protein
MERQDLLAGSLGPPATYLPEDPEAAAALRDGGDPAAVAARVPAATR